MLDSLRIYKLMDSFRKNMKIYFAGLTTARFEAFFEMKKFDKILKVKK